MNKIEPTLHQAETYSKTEAASSAVEAGDARDAAASPSKYFGSKIG